jgi:hypothetical protein
MNEITEEQKQEQRRKYALVHSRFLIDSCERELGCRRTNAEGRQLLAKEIIFRKKQDVGQFDPKARATLVRHPQYVYDAAIDYLNKMEA